MLTDRYDLPVSTTSAAARDAYVRGCAAKLTMFPGAVEAFDYAIAADPGFALAHAARAHYANNPDKPGRNYGGLQLKLKNQDFFI